MAPLAVEPRNIDGGASARAFMLGHLTSPRGGDNVKTSHHAWQLESLPTERPDECSGMTESEYWKWFVDKQDLPQDIKQKVYGIPPKVDPSSYDEGKVHLIVFCEERSAMENSLCICLFQRTGIDKCAEMLSACTGQEITETELLKKGERILTLQRAYNAREGIGRENLDWPERFYSEGVTNGPNHGKVLSREEVKWCLDKYYELRDWDKETGTPTRRKLEALDLKDVADELERLKIK
jgi:aldehyde:ferredoxin oxidoreductase